MANEIIKFRAKHHHQVEPSCPCYLLTENTKGRGKEDLGKSNSLHLHNSSVQHQVVAYLSVVFGRARNLIGIQAYIGQKLHSISPRGIIDELWHKVTSRTTCFDIFADALSGGEILNGGFASLAASGIIAEGQG
jgi:hypothetical protein